jgi:hypothetical protein
VVCLLHVDVCIGGGCGVLIVVVCWKWLWLVGSRFDMRCWWL